MSLLSFTYAIELGIIFAILSLGVYISYRILDIADLTVDGSFVTGAAVSAVYAYNGNPYLGIFMGIISGALAGLLTALLHTKLKITALLSGILTQLALYSINLRIMGKPNIPLMDSVTTFTPIKKLEEWIKGLFPESMSDFARTLTMFTKGLFLLIFLALVIALLYWFLITRMGTAMRATGNNINMVRALGVNSDLMKIVGLMLSNALVALAGAIYAQHQGFADANMGIGMIVTGLASVIIGEVLLPSKKLLGSLISVAVGATIYRLIIAIAIELGMPSSDLRLVSSAIVALSLSVPLIKNLFTKYSGSKRGGVKNAKN